VCQFKERREKDKKPEDDKGDKKGGKKVAKK
jgi:hypothetical protein